MALGWGLVVIGAALAVLYGWIFCAAPPAPAKTVIKTLSVASLALAAPALGVPPAIALGLALGSIGDFFLSRSGERSFLAGMVAFAAGHLAYALAFFHAGAGLPGFAVFLPLLVLGLSTEVWLAPQTGSLRWPVRGYVVVILIMAVAAYGMPAGAGIVMLGATLFVLSDLLLAIDLFRFGPGRPSLWRARSLWAAYWAGQCLILLGIAGTL